MGARVGAQCGRCSRKGKEKKRVRIQIQSESDTAPENNARSGAVGGEVRWVSWWLLVCVPRVNAGARLRCGPAPRRFRHFGTALLLGSSHLHPPPTSTSPPPVFGTHPQFLEESTEVPSSLARLPARSACRTALESRPRARGCSLKRRRIQRAVPLVQRDEFSGDPVPASPNLTWVTVCPHFRTPFV